MLNNKKLSSKYLSLLLRHKPELIEIKPQNGAWFKVTELIENLNKTGTYVDVVLLKNIVSNDAKKRYSFNEDETLIRANYGHSFSVEFEYEPAIPPEILYHGTIEKNIPSIMENGLQKMNRQFVHLSKDIETALKVGSRRGKPIILEINALEMHQNGFAFYYTPDSGIWLVDNVPEEFIEK